MVMMMMLPVVLDAVKLVAKVMVIVTMKWVEVVVMLL